MSTREKRENELFDSIAQRYGQKDLATGARLARRHRLLQTFRKIPPTEGQSLLEIGCGAGYAAAYLQGRYASYEGIDFAEGLISYATKYNDLPGASFSFRNVKDLPAEKKFNVIFMIGVLHHLDDAAGVVGQLREHLWPGGWLVANEPHSGNPLISGLRYLRKKVDPAYSDDQREYSMMELYELLDGAGYSEVSIFHQGFFSTPFAEVILPFQAVTGLFSRLSCGVDNWLEGKEWSVLRRLSWNLVVQGKLPD